MNLASRLEGQCKTYQVEIIIGDNTRQLASEYAAVEIDSVMVKGKTEPERIWALIGGPELTQEPAFAELVKAQQAFLDQYRAGGFVEALDLLPACEALADAVGWRQGYYGMMRERVDALIDDSPPEWTGVYVAKEK